MAEQADSDRSEQATAYKLHKAKERGSVSKSPEVTYLAVLFCFTIVVFALGDSAVERIAREISNGLSMAGNGTLSIHGMGFVAGAMLTGCVAVLSPIVMTLWLAAAVGNFLQIGPVFSTTALKPDFNRLNPAQGFKRLFSLRVFYELGRSAAKILIGGVIGVTWASSHMGEILASRMHTPWGFAHALLKAAGSGLVLLVIGALVIAAIDWWFSRWYFLREMRMSKREVKQEHKDREGDPRIKSKLREIRMELMQRLRSLSQVRESDALITNPTHFAVAISYRRGEMPAPRITAKGAGAMATAMRILARRHSVPIIENPPLARALFAEADAEQWVPEAHYHAVARILMWVFSIRDRKQHQFVS